MISVPVSSAFAVAACWEKCFNSSFKAGIKIPSAFLRHTQRCFTAALQEEMKVTGVNNMTVTYPEKVFGISKAR